MTSLLHAKRFRTNFCQLVKGNSPLPQLQIISPLLI